MSTEGQKFELIEENLKLNVLPKLNAEMQEEGIFLNNYNQLLTWQEILEVFGSINLRHDGALDAK